MLSRTSRGVLRFDEFAAPEDHFNRVNEISVEPGMPRQETRDFRERLHEKTGLKFGLMLSHLFQGTTESLPNKDRVGLATISAALFQWDILKRGTPMEGQFHLGLEARWDYGFASPFELGFDSTGSAIGTADPYNAYNPAVVIRDLFFRQGGEEAGWCYRIGKITTDRLLTTSSWMDPTATFLPVGTSGASSIALPDSGFGAALGLYMNDRLRMGGVISDANGDRFNFGGPGKGDLFKAVELQTQILPPVTEHGGYSTFTIWHTDGTADGTPIGSQGGVDDAWLDEQLRGKT